MIIQVNVREPKEISFSFRFNEKSRLFCTIGAGVANGIASRLRVVESGVGKPVQAGSGTYPASYSMLTGPFPEGETAGA
jgi:hypothetical protein